MYLASVRCQKLEFKGLLQPNVVNSSYRNIFDHCNRMYIKYCLNVPIVILLSSVFQLKRGLSVKLSPLLITVANSGDINMLGHCIR